MNLKVTPFNPINDLKEALSGGGSVMIRSGETDYPLAIFYTYEPKQIQALVGDKHIIQKRDKFENLDIVRYRLGKDLSFIRLQTKNFAIIEGETLFIRPFTDTPIRSAESVAVEWVQNHLDQSKDLVIREVTQIKDAR